MPSRPSPPLCTRRLPRLPYHRARPRVVSRSYVLSVVRCRSIASHSQAQGSVRLQKTPHRSYCIGSCTFVLEMQSLPFRSLISARTGHLFFIKNAPRRPNSQASMECHYAIKNQRYIECRPVSIPQRPNVPVRVNFSRSGSSYRVQTPDRSAPSHPLTMSANSPKRSAPCTTNCLAAPDASCSRIPDWSYPWARSSSGSP